MGKTIRVHPKFGLNPTMEVCFWCGEDTGDIALLGSAIRGEAPRRMTLNQNPCPACAAKWAQGIVILGVESGGRNELTGQYMVLKREAIERIFADDPDLVKILTTGRVAMYEDAFKILAEKAR